MNMEDFKNLNEIMIQSEEIFDGQVLHLFKDTVELPNGKNATRETIRHIGAVAIVPMTEDGKVIVERQFRYPLNCVITEIPAGKLDCKTENRLAAAKRELEEETGIKAEGAELLFVMYPSPGYTDEKIYIYRAYEGAKVATHLDDGEFLDAEYIPLEKVKEMMKTGEIKDGKTIIALQAYFLSE